MTLIDIFLLAIALAVDAFVVSFSYGLVICKQRMTSALKLAFSVGFGQFIMPILGWYGARSIYSFIEQVDHWIAFFVFLTLGTKVIADSSQNRDYQEKNKNSLSFKVLLIIGVATSIDAFVSGSMLYFIKTPICLPSVIIGLTAFIGSLIGFNLCCVFKKFKTCWLEQISGVILILLGCKILYEHIG